MPVVHHQYPVSVGRWHARGRRCSQDFRLPVLVTDSFSDRSSSYACYRVNLIYAHGVSTLGPSQAGKLSFSFVNTDAK